MRHIPMLISLLVALNCKQYGSAQTYLSFFIKGANNGVVLNYKEASNGASYMPLFPNSIIAPYKIEIFFNQVSLDIKAEYKNKQRVQLPYEFEYGYDKSDPELILEKTTNKYFMGQYDFDKDKIDEIIFAVQDKSADALSVNIIKYHPPMNDKSISKKENWELIGVLSASMLNPIEGVIKDSSIRFDRGLRGFYYEWTFVKGKFVDTGNY